MFKHPYWSYLISKFAAIPLYILYIDVSFSFKFPVSIQRSMLVIKIWGTLVFWGLGAASLSVLLGVLLRAASAQGQRKAWYYTGNQSAVEKV